MSSSSLGVRRANGIVYGYFRGKRCLFETLRQAWQLVSEYDPSGQKRSYRLSPVRLSFDVTAVLNSTTLQARHSLKDVPEDRQLEFARTISAFFRGLQRTISVLHLGTVTQREHGTTRSTAVGIIFVKAPDKAIGGWEKRLGICLWDVFQVKSSDLKEHQGAACILSGVSSMWSEDECLIG